jgi:7-carboxy-7-deazaguanine synthase
MLCLSEVYQSIQGEGPRVGEPTVFIRFAGCNLRCPGWPCDTPFAVDPKNYRNEWRTVSHIDVVKEVLDVASGLHSNICFTGGEPFLQPKQTLEHLVQALMEEGFTVFEAFTNGTLKFSDWLQERIYLVMDWKLKGSGESFEGMRVKNFMRLDGQDAIKFTIKDYEDFEEAYDLWYFLEDLLDQEGRPTWERPQYFYGPVWGELEPAELVEWVLLHQIPWRLNLQTHNIIWDRTKRGI